MRGSLRLTVLVFVAAIAGCGEPTAPPVIDAGLDGATGMDGGDRDGGPPGECTSDPDCHDDTFCDGEEACMPGATDADERGCVEATVRPCDATETCDEASRTCDAICPDADGDGHGGVACGGDDCDDDDENRYAGNIEVCDMAAHDEDCNVETYGFLDADSDGSAAGVCCNVLADGSLGCGDDCNDGDSTVNPRAGDGPPLFCDGVDNDCSGTSDEGCPCVEGETRECGTEPQLTRVGICRPGTQVCSGGTYTDTCIGATAAAEEVCDGLDNDCDGTPDEDVLRTYYPDVDTDGFGRLGGTPTMACSAPAGYSSNATDCDDAIASVNPGATEVCNGLDDNCLGGADEGFVGTFYEDDDGDGFGNAMVSMMSCTPPSGYVRNATDCDDTNGSRNPATIEGCNLVDDNCNGMTDEGLLRTFYADGDGDAWGVAGTTMEGCTVPTGYSERSGDCDDTRASTNPAAPEVCNSFDDNCAGGIDEGVVRTFYRDVDRDGFGLDGMTMPACTAPSGYADRGGDCDDTTPGVSPGTAESCNGRDDNCDGTTDPGCACTDGAVRNCGPTSDTGECTYGAQTCVGGGWGGCVGAVMSSAETCNGLDDDCDSMVDDGVTVTGCYRDGDGDGYGTGGATSQCRDASRATFGFCPVGWVNTATDCNDGVSSIRPMSIEICDGVDQDCDGMADEGSTIACFGDADADGFGAGAATQRCADPARVAFGMCPSGFTNVATDCNDGASTVRPGAAEICNDVDDDCDAMVDDGVSVMPCHTDADGDGFGTGAATTRCRDASRMTFGYCPVGTTNVATDCNDASSAVRPGGTETCNGLDDDCDGMTDELLLASGCYLDGDSDGYGAGAASTRCRDAARAAYGFCPVGYANVATDCNDANGTVHPTAAELCNGVDDDCDATVDDGATATPCYLDGDIDGYGSGASLVRCRDASRVAQGYCPVGYTNVATDCNDGNASVSPGDPEVCNGADDDCDGTADDGTTVSCYSDSDGDGFGTGAMLARCRDAARVAFGECPVGYTNVATDCNDGNASISPADPEICNGIDDDCDATIDDGVTVAGCFPDVDADNYGRAGATAATQCRDSTRGANGFCPLGYDNDALDCNDANASVRPGATETCDGVDQDCDATIDDGVTQQWFRDADSDGYGALTRSGPSTCSPDSGYLTTGGDCNDLAGTGAEIHPGAAELCNGVDDNCVTGIDEMALAGPQCSGENPSAVHVSGWMCTTATCVPTCSGAWRDCDGIAANGCEVDTRITEDHCGACGNSCGEGGVCTSSVCDTIVDLVAGGSNTCVLRSSGQLVCWGDGGAGQFADAAREDELSPRLITAITAVDAIAIGDAPDTGTFVTLYARQANLLYAWGQNGLYEVGNGTAISPVITPVAVLSANFGNFSGGVGHVCARTGAGASPGVRCWGTNTYGELGETLLSAPFRSTPPTTSQVSGYADIAAGDQYSCAISSGAIIRCWGRSGPSGRLGDGTTTTVEVATPVNVVLPASFTLPTDVDVGLDHACALGTGDATHANVVCWGRGVDGELGHNLSVDASSPVHAYFAAGVPLTYSAISVGARHTCAISNSAGSTGTLWCWGDNFYGQLGSGTVGTDDNDPTLVAGLSNAVDVACGSGHTCARTATGDVYCWGRNGSGQLGLGDTVNRSVPTLVPGL